MSIEEDNPPEKGGFFLSVPNFCLGRKLNMKLLLHFLFDRAIYSTKRELCLKGVPKRKLGNE